MVRCADHRVGAGAVGASSSICLTGPGGAGKSTVGALLADLLARPFLDLDQSFAARHGDIDQFIASHGYRAYAHANIEVYHAIASGQRNGVIALSSGFMTYPRAIHQRYAALRQAIASSHTTFVLLPSLDLESCVAETVRRQRARPVAKWSPEREEAVIRERFVTYLALPAPKIETMRPPAEIAMEIAVRLASTLADDGDIEHDLRQHEEDELSEERFAAICRIPIELRRTGTSLRDAVRASGYAALRGEFSARSLADYLRQHPEFVEKWAAYSDGKRGGTSWYFRRPASVGRISLEPPPMRELHYPDPAAACAAFMIAELNEIVDGDSVV